MSFFIDENGIGFRCDYSDLEYYISLAELRELLAEYARETHPNEDQDELIKLDILAPQQDAIRLNCPGTRECVPDYRKYCIAECYRVVEED